MLQIGLDAILTGHADGEISRRSRCALLLWALSKPCLQGKDYSDPMRRFRQREYLATVVDAYQPTILLRGYQSELQNKLFSSAFGCLTCSE